MFWRCRKKFVLAEILHHPIRTKSLYTEALDIHLRKSVYGSCSLFMTDQVIYDWRVLFVALWPLLTTSGAYSMTVCMTGGHDVGDGQGTCCHSQLLVYTTWLALMSSAIYRHCLVHEGAVAAHTVLSVVAQESVQNMWNSAHCMRCTPTGEFHEFMLSWNSYQPSTILCIIEIVLYMLQSGLH